MKPGYGVKMAHNEILEGNYIQGLIQEHF